MERMKKAGREVDWVPFLHDLLIKLPIKQGPSYLLVKGGNTMDIMGPGLELHSALPLLKDRTVRGHACYP